MKQLKSIAASALAAAALVMTFGIGGASATTLETEGSTRNQSVDIEFRVALGTKTVLKDTAGFSKNECSTSRIRGKTASPFTGTSVTGALTTLSFESCTRPVTVHTNGSLEVTYTLGTNGTVASEGAVWTVGSAIGTLTCQTGSTTNIGTLTGTSAGWATLDINAVLNCGIIPSAKWEGVYEETWAEGLGVSS